MFVPHFLPKDAGQTRFFQAQGGAVWQAYTVPLGALMLSILAVGAGGAGGAGFSAAAGAARGGGGGGGSGTISRLIAPTALLPQTLFVHVGLGGTGAGGWSVVRVLPEGSITTTLPPLSLVTSPGGNPGAAGSGTAGGAGGTIPTGVQHGAYSALGALASIGGQAGVAGGAQTGAAGTTVTWAALGLFTSPGAGGGGTTSADFAGGAINGVGFCPTIPGGLAGSNDGLAGFELRLPPTFTGGSGGGSSNTGVGGAGGAGSFGSGGGGGGGGTTGGLGGRGGDGLVIITAW